jgi:acyl-CoA thioester hydrolase
MPPTFTCHFTWNIRVYFEDTDAGGVVFYANYLKFFERARTEWLRAAGIGQQSMTQTHGVVFVVKSTAVDYHAPARLDNELKISVVVEKMGRASVQFIQQAWRITQDEYGSSEELLATGRIKVGCVDLASFRPSEIPPNVLASIRTMEQRRE